MSEYDNMSDDELEALYKTTLPKTASQIKVKQDGSQVSILDRANIKNFGGSTDETIKYLKDEYPEAEVDYIDGQVVTKMPGQKSFHALDSTNWWDPEDITDVVYDVVGGVAEGAATAAGGLAGLASPIPGGAALGAMGAGGVSSGAIEALRQFIGNQTGAKQGYDTGDIGMSAGVGAVMPLALGSGATKTAIKNMATNTPKAARIFKKATEGAQIGDIGKNEVGILKDYIEQSQRGLFGKGKDKAIEALSGIPAGNIRTAGKDIARTIELEKLGKTREFAEETSDLIGNTIDVHLAQASDDLGEALTKSGVVLNTERVMGPWFDSLDKIQKMGDGLDTDNELKAMINQIKGLEIVKDGELVPEISAEQAMFFAQRLKDLAGNIDSGKLVLSDTRKAATQEISKAAKRSGAILTEMIDDAIGPEFRATWKEIKDFERFVRPKFKDAATAQKTLLSSSNKSKRQILEEMGRFDKRFDTNLTERINDTAAFKLWNEPSFSAKSGGGSTSTSRTGAAMVAGGEAARSGAEMLNIGPTGQRVARALGAIGLDKAMSPAAIRAAHEAKNALPDWLKAMYPGNAIEALANKKPKLRMGRGATPASAWELMYQKDQGEN